MTDLMTYFTYFTYFKVICQILSPFFSDFTLTFLLFNILKVISRSWTYFKNASCACGLACFCGSNVPLGLQCEP